MNNFSKKRELVVLSDGYIAHLRDHSTAPTRNSTSPYPRPSFAVSNPQLFSPLTSRTNPNYHGETLPEEFFHVIRDKHGKDIAAILFYKSVIAPTAETTSCFDDSILDALVAAVGEDRAYLYYNILELEQEFLSRNLTEIDQKMNYFWHNYKKDKIPPHLKRLCTDFQNSIHKCNEWTRNEL